MNKNISSFRELGFESQNTYDGLQPFATLVPLDPMPSSEGMRHSNGAHTHMKANKVIIISLKIIDKQNRIVTMF